MTIRVRVQPKRWKCSIARGIFIYTSPCLRLHPQSAPQSKPLDPDCHSFKITLSFIHHVPIKLDNKAHWHGLDAGCQSHTTTNQRVSNTGFSMLPFVNNSLVTRYGALFKLQYFQSFSQTILSLMVFHGVSSRLLGPIHTQTRLPPGSFDLTILRSNVAL